jgi:hypothetical protein
MANDGSKAQRRIVMRSIAIWLVLICAEILHGILRAIVLVPLVGEFRSNQIGVFSGSAIILVIAYFTIRWIGAKQRSELLIVGFLWLLLTVAFEVLFGRLVMGLGWERFGSDYNLLQGGLMPVGLLVLSLSPMIAARIRRIG